MYHNRVEPQAKSLKVTSIENVEHRSEIGAKALSNFGPFSEGVQCVHTTIEHTIVAEIDNT